jgi:hypothetical protein
MANEKRGRMPYDHVGNYLESGYCPDCGVPLDSAGDCPNPFCPAKDDTTPLDSDDEVTK